MLVVITIVVTLFYLVITAPSINSDRKTLVNSIKPRLRKTVSIYLVHVLFTMITS